MSSSSSNLPVIETAVLQQLLVQYQSRLLKEAKSDSSEGVAGGFSGSFAADTKHLDTTKVGLTNAKLTIVQNLSKYLSQSDIPGFLQYLGEYEKVLASARDYNPLTSHGGAFIAEVKNAVPDIETNPHYIIGTTLGTIDRYLEAKNKIDILGNEVKDEEKIVESNREESALISMAAGLRATLLGGKVTVDQKLASINQVMTTMPGFAQRVIAADPTPWYAIFASALPEKGLLADLDVIKEKLGKRSENVASISPPSQ